MQQVTGQSGAGTILEMANWYVRVKHLWADEWVDAPYLAPLSFLEAVSPTITSARLLFDYGNVKREDSADFAVEDPQRLLDWYVQIIGIWPVAGVSAALWHGVIADEQDSPGGDATTPKGRQELAAFGLEYLLDRATICGATCETTGASVEIKVSPTFNRPARHGAGLLGNRSGAKQAESGAYEFSKISHDVWTHRDIAEYVLALHHPTGIEFELSGQYDVLDALTSVQDLEGLTVRQALDLLIGRRRGMGWTVRTTGAGKALVHVFTVFDEDVSEGEVTIPANPDQQTLDLTDVAKLVEPVVKLATSGRYDKVIVQGAPLVTCFTASVGNGSLEAAWTVGLETEYLAGASGVTGYADLSDGEKAEANDTARGADRLTPVYGHLRVPSDWDWTAVHGDGVAPCIKNDGRIDRFNNQTIWHGERPFRRSLPMLEGLDYSTWPATQTGVSGLTAELKKPFVVAWYNGGYIPVDRLNMATDGDVPNARVRMLDADMAIEVAFPTNHIAASADWSGAEATNWDPALDWREYYATVAVETDERICVEVDIGTGRSSEMVKTLVIDVPDAEAWWIAPGTVIDVNADGTVKRASSGGYQTRDDSPRLRVIAALAKGWYAKERRAVRVTMNTIEDLPRPGVILRAVDQGWHLEQVNSVVTRRVFDCVANTTTVETGFLELDATALAGRATGAADSRLAAREMGRLGREVRALKEHTANLPVRGFPE